MKDPNADLTDLEMMLDPTRWPNFNHLYGGVLPLKHPDALSEAFSDAGFGILIVRKDDKLGWVYQWEWKRKIHDLGAAPDFNHIVNGGQELIRLLVQSGWVVD